MRLYLLEAMQHQMAYEHPSRVLTSTILIRNVIQYIPSSADNLIGRNVNEMVVDLVVSTSIHITYV